MNFFVVLSILFFDFLGYAAVIPIVPLILLDTPHSILPSEFPQASRYLLLGTLLSTFPLAQIFSSPLLGFFSDAISRKKIFLLSYFGNAIGYLCFGWGVLSSSLPLLYLGNFIAGITSGHLSAAHALVADLEPTPKKTRYYSLFHLAMGAAFVLGPLCSGYLLKLKTNSCSLPFFCCAGFAIINFLALHFFLKESDKPFNIGSFMEITTHFKQLIFASSQMRNLFLSLLLFFFGWYFFIKVFQVLLIHQTHFQENGFFKILSYFGFCCVATQALFSTFIFRYTSPIRLIPYSLLVLGLSLFSFLFIHTFLTAMLGVTLFSIAYSLLCPAFIAAISDSGSSHDQGKLMGIHQSIQALAKFSGPILAAGTMSIAPTIPIWVSCFAILGSGLIFFRFVQEKEKITSRSF